jgi:hypothetical protein
MDLLPDRHSVLCRSNHVLAAEVGAELVVMENTSSTFHSLNNTAALIWSLVDGERTVDGIIGEIAGALGLDVATIEQDCLSALATMCSDEILVVASDRSDNPSAALLRTPGASRFTTQIWARRPGTTASTRDAVPGLVEAILDAAAEPAPFLSIALAVFARFPERLATAVEAFTPTFERLVGDGVLEQVG